MPSFTSAEIFRNFASCLGVLALGPLGTAPVLPGSSTGNGETLLDFDSFLWTGVWDVVTSFTTGICALKTDYFLSNGVCGPVVVLETDFFSLDILEGWW